MEHLLEHEHECSIGAQHSGLRGLWVVADLRRAMLDILGAAARSCYEPCDMGDQSGWLKYDIQRFPIRIEVT